MMKILYVVHQFFPRYYTGTERFTLELAKQMQRMGHSVTVLSYEPAPSNEGFDKLTDEVLVKRYTYDHLAVITLKLASTTTDLHIVKPAIGRAFEALQMKCDVVHVCHPMWLASVIRTCRSRGIPIVMTLTDSWLLCPRGLIDRNYRICNGPEAGERCMSICGFDQSIKARYAESYLVFNSADEVVAGSKFLPALFAKNEWTREMLVVPHSINHSHVKLNARVPETNLVFAYIGAITWHKGVHILIEAFRNAPNPDLRLRIYGSLAAQPNYTEELLAMAKGDERIQFMGSFDMEEALPQVMSDVSGLVVPSCYYENYPLVMLIALAYQVPVIASRIGGIPEAIKDGTNGFLFESGNAQQLAQIINRISDNPSLLQQLAEKIVKPRRTEEEALEYECIYRRLLSIDA